MRRPSRGRGVVGSWRLLPGGSFRQVSSFGVLVSLRHFAQETRSETRELISASGLAHLVSQTQILRLPAKNRLNKKLSILNQPSLHCCWEALLQVSLELFVVFCRSSVVEFLFQVDGRTYITSPWMSRSISLQTAPLS